MLTVKQAKGLGVVFVKGDVVKDSHGGVYSDEWVANDCGDFDNDIVISFTDRKHTGNETPCCGDLPVIVRLSRGNTVSSRYASWFNWLIEGVSGDIKSWKPDLESLEKLANKREEKPMTEKQYTYELVTDLSTNEIAKAMIDGEVFYSEHGKYFASWNNGTFKSGDGSHVSTNGKFYRRKEITWVDVLNRLDKKPLIHDDGTMFSIIECSQDDFIKACHDIYHLTK